jgi:hypothetical protein
MSYDDVKEFEGEAYSGMAVGGEHSWIYPHGLWHEQKVAPDRWIFTFRSIKERERAAPAGSGADRGAQFHWYLIAHQRVRKIDADTYDTFMSGVKHKVAHRRPGWRKWSSGYPDQPSEQKRITEILEEALREVRDNPSHPKVASLAEF